MKRARKPKAVRNEARGTWVFFPVVDGKRTTRKLGAMTELTQEQADRKAMEMLRSNEGPKRAELSNGVGDR